MSSTLKLKHMFSAAASDLGVEVVEDYKVGPVGADQVVEVPVHLPRFGGRIGMLVVTDLSQLGESPDALVRRGYGCSVLSATSSKRTPYDRESFIAMLADWGWNGEDSARPPWLPASEPGA